jgi:hypothetical protein
VVQSAITMVSLPFFTTQKLQIPLNAADRLIDVPWSVDMGVAPNNVTLIQVGHLGAS